MFNESTLERLRTQHPRFHDAAYLFVLSALQFAIQRLPEERHISGPELSEAVRDLAIDRFGPMARTVLEYWGIQSTTDLGDMVFALVEQGVLLKREEDSPEDFEQVFDFEEAFELDYPWGSGL